MTSITPSPEGVTLVLGPVWREEEEEHECWTAEVQVNGGYEVMATVHGGSEQEATDRANIIITALSQPIPTMGAEDVDSIVEQALALAAQCDTGRRDWQVAYHAVMLTRLATSQREGVLRSALEALEPFAKLGGPINGEAGRPAYVDAIGGTDCGEELQLSTYVGNGTRIEVVHASDFRRAYAARLALSSDGGEKA